MLTAGYIVYTRIYSPGCGQATIGCFVRDLFPSAASGQGERECGSWGVSREKWAMKRGGALRRGVMRWRWRSLSLGQIVAQVGFSLWLAALGGCSESQPERPERIILVVADTLRADRVGAYGGRAKTPHMDELARSGQIFTEARSSFHLTTMSMASLFTGQVPSLETGRGNQSLPYTSETFCGMARFRTEGDPACVPEKLETLAEELRARGYWTLAVVGNPLLFDPYGYSQGFDEWVEVGRIPGGLFRTGSTLEHALERTGEQINAALFEALDQRPSDHFFLFAHYLDVHDWPSRNHAYAHGVEVFDRFLGQLVDYLKARSLFEGSVIVVTSDHGEELGEEHFRQSLGLHFGNPSYEPVLRIPLIVSPPRFENTDAPVRGQDLKNMVLALSEPGAGVREKIVLNGEEEVFISEQSYQTIQTGRWKSFWPRDGSSPSLVDLAQDPGETVDLAESNPEVLVRHRSRLDEIAEEHWTSPDLLFLEFSEEDRERLRALGYLEALGQGERE